jgi:hypothetical protein
MPTVYCLLRIDRHYYLHILAYIDKNANNAIRTYRGNNSLSLTGSSYTMIIMSRLKTVIN